MSETAGVVLPARPYVPGRTPRHGEDEPLFALADAAPAVTDPARWADNAAWCGGLEAYRADYFWEAHELWEPVWMNARPNSRERTLVQGTIQLANACLKLVMARPNAARRLLATTLACLEEAAGAEPLMGLSVLAIRDEVAAFSRTIADLGDGEATAATLAAVAARPALDPRMHYNAEN